MTDFTSYLRLGVDSRDAVTAQQNLNRMAGAADKADRSFSVLGGASKILGAALGAVGAGKIAGDLIEVSRQTGVLRAGLETATGSSQAAADSFKAITQLATQLPESVNDVTTAFTKLVNYGLDPSQEAIKSYSNTASALGKDLTQMIEAVADAATGEFERLKEFGIKSKKEGDNVSFTFRGVTTTIKNSAEEIEGYLQGLGNVQFAGSAEKQMESLDGAISNIGDSYDGLLRSISDAGAGDFIASSIRTVSEAMGELTAMIDSGQFGAMFDAYIGKFQGFMDAGRTAFEVVSIAWQDLTSGIDGNVISDAFVNMPENIKAFVQIAVVELATLYEKAKIYLNPKNWVGDQSFEELLSGINMVREESITQILAEREAAIQSFDDQIKAANDLRASYDTANQSVIDLGQFAIKSGEQAQGAMSGASKEAEKYADAVKKIQLGEWDSLDAALGKENKQWESLEKQNEEFEKLISSVDNFGGAWTRTGSIVADQLGTMIDGFNDYMSQLDALASAEKDVAKAMLEAKNPDQVAKAEAAAIKLSKERQKAEISGYKSMAGAAASMFKENSKARKAFHAIEMSLSAVELAMSIKNTATEIALSLSRGTAAAAEGVANQSKGDPYTAWARMAAMAAVMAGLGFAVGGGGGGGGTSAAAVQESQGTGSVLGSNDKSASLQNSIDNYSEIGMDQLVELRGIREGLAQFNGGITQLAMGVSTSALSDQKYLQFADTHLGVALESGRFETTGIRKQDWKTRERLAPFQAEMVDIFNYIGDTAKEAMNSLGLSAQESINSFYLQIGKVSFEGLSGEEIQQELSAIFSQQADLITGHLAPAMKEYQQMGEGLFETLTRVAKEQATFNDYMDKMGLSMQGVSSLMAIDMAQSIADLMGGFENFTDAASQYVDKFFTDEEKFGMLQRSLSETFGALNVTMPDSLMGFRSLVEGIDRTTIEGQRLFASLLEISPSFAEFIEQMEGMKSATEDMANSAAEAANKIAQSAFNMMQSAINSEKKRIQDIVSGAGTAKSALDKAVAAEKSTLKTAYDERVAEIKALADAEKVAQDAINKARIDSLNDERDAVQDRISALSGLFDELNKSVFDIALKSDELTRARRNAASFEIDTALSNARAGRGLPMEGQLSQALDILRDNPSSLYATAEEMAFETAKLQNKLTELAGLTGDQLSRDEKSLLAIDAQIASAEASSKFYETATTKYDEMIEQATKQYEADVAAQDAILAKAQEQYDALTGIDTKTLSVEAALIKYNESLLAADFENAQGQYERLDSLLSTGQSQLNALLSIDDRILSVNDAVGKFIESINAAQSDSTNKEMLAQIQRMADEITQLREEQRSQAFAQQKALNATAKNTTELVYA